jgi:hypothetical protein
MQIKFRIVLLLLSVISISYPNITVADEKMKFAGISLGLTSQEVISILLNEPEYTVFSRNGVRATSILVGDNEDTLYASDSPLHTKILCNSKKLSPDKGTEGYFNFSNISFNQIMIDHPNLIFKNDKLAIWKGVMKLELKEYEILIKSLVNKYGNYQSNYTKKFGADYNTWNNGSYSLKLSPCFESIHSDLGKRQYDKANSKINIWFAFTDNNALNECKKEKEVFQRKQQNEFLKKNDSVISVFGLNAFMTKEVVYNVLSMEDKEYIYTGTDLASRYWGGVRYSFVEKNSNGHSLEADKVLDDWRKLPDTVVFNRNYLENGVLVEISFYKNMLLELSLRAGTQGNCMKIYDAMLQFINKNTKYGKRTLSSKNGYINDNFKIVYDNYKLSLQYSNSAGIAQILLQNTKLIDDRNEKASSSIQKGINKLLANLDKSLMYIYKIGYKIDFNLEATGSFDPIEQKRIPIDYNYQKNGMKFYEYSKHFSNNYFETDGKINDSCCVPYCCHSNLIQIVTENDLVKSIATAISPIYYKSWQDALKDKSIIIKSLIEILDKKYGQSISVDYLTRKSKYWKINGNLFEIIIEDKAPMQSNISFGGQNAVYFVFRKDSPNDVIYKKTSKKGLLD